MGGMWLLCVADLEWVVVRAQGGDEPARSRHILAGQAQRRRSAFFDECRVAETIKLLDTLPAPDLTWPPGAPLSTAIAERSGWGGIACCAGFDASPKRLHTGLGAPPLVEATEQAANALPVRQVGEGGRTRGPGLRARGLPHAAVNGIYVWRLDGGNACGRAGVRDRLLCFGGSPTAGFEVLATMVQEFTGALVTERNLPMVFFDMGECCVDAGLMQV